MNIEEWKSLAAFVVPQLPEYTQSFGIFFNSKRAMELLNNQEYDFLHALLENLWNELPNSPEIRIGIFFALCDLCTEFPLSNAN